MQLKFVLLALLGSAFAQKDIFLSQLDSVHKALDALDVSVTGLAPGGDVAAQTAALTGKARGVLAALDAATAAISGAAALDIGGSASIVAPADHLVKETDKAIANLIAKKDIIAASKQTALVLQALKAQAASAQKLADAIGSKVPDAAKAIAVSQAGKISAAISKGIAAYS